MSHPVLELQAAETMSDQLKNRRQRLAEREQVQAARNDLIRWNESRKLLHQRLDELEKQVEQSEKESHDIDRKRTKLEAQLKTVIAPREAEALQSEIATLNARRSELDDSELVALEEQSRLEDELASVLGQERALTDTLTTADTALAAAERDIDGELKGIANRLDGLRSEVDKAVLKRYDRLRSHFVVAATKLSGSRCEGCHLDLSAHEVDDVKDALAASGMADCPQCGRLLFG
ncbi:MAG TPA: C4-type zinc ribbon domain-containing protein [Ilumatobacter sp.]|nr:C4-type zinc ribbon domain-containing protein [Ilumatobacter sp.]